MDTCTAPVSPVVDMWGTFRQLCPILISCQTLVIVAHPLRTVSMPCPSCNRQWAQSRSVEQAIQLRSDWTSST